MVAAICPWATLLLPKGTPRHHTPVFGASSGSLLVSKVGSILASAEAEACDVVLVCVANLLDETVRSEPLE